MLLGGIDGEEPSLYYIDYLGTKQKTNFGAHGYCSYFLLSLFDRHWKVRLRDLRVFLRAKCSRAPVLVGALHFTLAASCSHRTYSPRAHAHTHTHTHTHTSIHTHTNAHTTFTWYTVAFRLRSLRTSLTHPLSRVLSHPSCMYVILWL
jgi:hypothetical protein